MLWHKRIYSALSLVLFACACISCESDSSSSSGTYDPPALDEALSGTWYGWFDDDIYSKDMKFDENDPDNIFVVGIITREKTARFIGDASQYVTGAAMLDIEDTGHIAFPKYFTADISCYTWDTTGLGEHDAGDWYLADIVPHSLAGNSVFSSGWLLGKYWATGSEEKRYFELYGYSSSGINPSIGKLAGEWKIEHAFKSGNDLTFTIEADGTMEGQDVYGNRLNGAISIHVSAEDPKEEIYDVRLTLDPKDAPYPTVDLEGLASYLVSRNTTTDQVEESLAVGVTGDGHMVTGIAARVPEGD